MTRARPNSCSTSPLARKLGVKPGARLALVAAPDGLERLLVVPESVRVHSRLAGRFDVIVCFCRRRAELERRLARLRAALEPDGGLWIAWPKRSSGVATDIDENLLRDLVLPTGLVDNKVCAIDDTWSGLRFVVRISER